MRVNRKAFTLIEVVAVVGIIIVLAGLLIPTVKYSMTRSNVAKANAEIAQIDAALTAFYTDNGSFPRTGQMLASLDSGYYAFDASRKSGVEYKDPFGCEYLYISPGVISSKGYDLVSVGAVNASHDVAMLDSLIYGLSTHIVNSGGNGAITVGRPTGLDNSSIWRLSEPTYDIAILGALSLLRNTNVGFDLAVMINLSNIPIYFADLTGTGALAYFDPYIPVIVLDLTLAEGPSESIAAVIAHEATHLADYLSSGDTDFDSIDEEYDAYYNEAMVWKELAEGKVFTNLEYEEYKDSIYEQNIEREDENLALMEMGEEAVREDLRRRYPWAPEEDQWGDAYVVAKKY